MEKPHQRRASCGSSSQTSVWGWLLQSTPSPMGMWGFCASGGFFSASCPRILEHVLKAP